MQEIGLYCEAVQEHQVSKTHEQIQILAACADDIVSGFAATQNNKNKRRPMLQAFPQAFAKPEDKPLTEIEKAYALARKLDSLVDVDEE